MKHQYKLEHKMIWGVYKLCQCLERVYVLCKHFISWLMIFTGHSEKNGSASISQSSSLIRDDGVNIKILVALSGLLP